MSNFKTPPNFRDLSGQRFGRLRVLSRTADKVGPNGAHSTVWNCLCRCGTYAAVLSVHLVQGKTKSCGCLLAESVLTRNLTHGHTVGHKKSRTYRAWRGVITRCCNPRHKSFAAYGGSGVTVCAQWRENFEQFLSDMGECPDEALTIDRIDNSKGYEPRNCRWASTTQQARNRDYCVLNEETASQLRRRRCDGVSFRELASEFSVSKSTAFACCSGKTWA